MALLDYLFPPQDNQLGGLLGIDDERLRKQAQQAGLLNMGLGIISASGPSRMPQGILQPVASGLMAGQQAYQGAITQQLADAMAARKAQQEETVIVPEGGTLLGKTSGKVIAQGAPKQPAKITEFVQAKEQGLIPQNMTFTEYQTMGRAPAANISVNMGEKNLFEIDKDVVQNLTNQAVSARQFATSATQINELLKGKGGGALVKLGAETAKSLGFENETVTANDLAKSLVVQTAVKVRPPGSGATSNLEFEAYINAVPSLANSESGRALMADANRRFAERAEKIADYSRSLYKKGEFNLTSVQEYDNKLGSVLPNDFYEKTNIAPRGRQATAQTGMPSMDAIEAELQRRRNARQQQGTR